MLEKLVPVGNLLLAELLFFCCSLTVVLAFPAAVALQRTCEMIITEHENSVLRSFGRHLVTGVRRYLLIGLVADLLVVALALSLLFWYAASGPLAGAALIVLIMVCGLLLSGYLNILAELASGVDRRFTELARNGWQRMLHRPLHSAGCVVIMLTWLLLVARLPTVLLVGSGLVPALLAYWLRHPGQRTTGNDQPRP